MNKPLNTLKDSSFPSYSRNPPLFRSMNKKRKLYYKSELLNYKQAQLFIKSNLMKDICEDIHNRMDKLNIFFLFFHKFITFLLAIQEKYFFFNRCLHSSISNFIRSRLDCLSNQTSWKSSMKIKTSAIQWLWFWVFSSCFTNL